MPPKKPRLKPGANQGKKPTPPPPAAGSSAAGPSGPPPEEKKPTVQELIGGKSWTGKLPQTLFYEHCIRTGWLKPDYTMRNEPGKGYLATVYIRAQNPKTFALETLYFRPPTEAPNGLPLDPQPHQPSPLEARHYTATYALHRVSSMRNVQLMLPPAYRKHWALFEDVKKQAGDRGRAWMWEADPFATRREYEAALAEAAAGISAGKGKEKKKTEGGGGGGGRGWEKVPEVDMSAGKRAVVERLVRKLHTWNPRGVVLSAERREELVKQLMGMGFREVHVKEACEWVKDGEEALEEWLLIHVPEDDMPQRFLPGNYATGMTFSSVADLPLAQEYAAKRLCQSGYTLDLCREALTMCAGSEALAAETLQHILLHGHPPPQPETITEDLISFADPTADAWTEELISLEAIWGADRFVRVSPTQFSVLLAPPDSDLGVVLSPKIWLEVRRPTVGGWNAEYPDTIPVLGIAVDAEPRLPAHVKLSLIRQTAEYAAAFCGEPMLFTLVDWVEANLHRIVANPGRLRDVSGAVTGSDERPGAGDVRATATVVGRKRPPKRSIDWTPGGEESERLFKIRAARWETPDQQTRLAARRRLPAWDLQEELIAAVDAAQVTIVAGETGSGKSTQCVQFILDDLILRRLGHAANIVCTQPRRISALGLADRVADERCGQVGAEIGYVIRGEARQKAGTTKVVFVTTGVLLRRLQMGDGLEDVSHVVVDEVHERSLDTDFLLILLKRILEKREDLRVVLMSATLDAEVFAEYFGGAQKVRVVQIKGRMFPVKDLYLDDVVTRTRFDGGGRLAVARKKRVDNEDLRGVDPRVGEVIRGIGDRINYNLIAATVAQIDEELGAEEGGILIFLPGTMEISRCLDAIKYLPSGASRFHALPLHASLQPSEQRRVFPPPPSGYRKVIAATNVAETSITIEDVVAVIDTGRVKETSYDPATNIVRLLETWASRAACQQRRGRAGRVAPGTCWKLYTRNAEARMQERPEPELKRVPLEQTCLGVKHMGVQDVRAFLASAISPPDTMAVDGALKLLERMGAMKDGDLTALGKHLAVIPADLRCGKLMVYGAIFGCLDAALTIAAVLTARPPFMASGDRRDDARASRAAFGDAQGDLLADCRAYEEWASLRKTAGIGQVRRWCEENNLSHHTLLDVASNRSQYTDSLKETGFLPIHYTDADPAYNYANASSPLVRGIIAGAFSPQVARIVMPEQRFASSSTGSVAVDPESRMVRYYGEGGQRVFVYPGSTLFDASSFVGDARFLAFASMGVSGRAAGAGATGNVGELGKVYLRDVTPINSYPLLLFGGDLTVDTMGRGITVDGWLRLRGWGRIGILLARLRKMLDGVLEERFERPERDLRADEVVECVRGLVEGGGS